MVAGLVIRHRCLGWLEINSALHGLFHNIKEGKKGHNIKEGIRFQLCLFPHSITQSLIYQELPQLNELPITLTFTVK